MGAVNAAGLNHSFSEPAPAVIGLPGEIGAQGAGRAASDARRRRLVTRI